MHKQNNIRESFLTAMFSLLGYLSNCDGPINKSEVKRVKLYMKKMNLSEQEHNKALLLLKSGASPDFNASETIQKFLESTTPKLIQILLVYLVTVAKSDGYLVEKELYAIQWIARKLNYKSIVFNHLLKMLYEQDQIAASRNPQPIDSVVPQDTSVSSQRKQAGNYSDREDVNSGPYVESNSQNQDLQKCYRVLGVNSEMTDDEIRMVYKKRVSQFHPDKLASKNLSPERLDAATEHFKKIQVAYAFIKKHRSIYIAS